MTYSSAPQTIRLQEWQTVVLPEVSLTDPDRALAESLGTGGGRRLLVEELRAGTRISTRSWVGLVRFEGFDVSIEPKLAGENLGLVQLLGFTTGLSGFRRVSARRTLPIEGRSLDLFDLLALLFAEECSTLIKGGLISDYLSREDVVPALRGRLLADRQLTRQFGRVDRLECRYDEYETDTPENQVVATALAVCARRIVDPGVRRQVKRLLNLFDGVCDPSGADLRLIRETLVYNRMNEQYREAHDLAWFILDGLGIRDLLSAGGTRSFAFLIDMNGLFERFVWRVLKIICARQGLRVHYQRKDRSILWDETHGRPYTSVIPDLLVESPHSRFALAVDAKYKQYDERRLSPGDIYQSFLYSFAYGPQGGDDIPRALVIYPASGVHLEGLVPPLRHRYLPPDQTLHPRESVLLIRRATGSDLGKVRALGIHVPTLLEEVRSEQEGLHAGLVSRSVREAFHL